MECTFPKFSRGLFSLRRLSLKANSADTGFTSIAKIARENHYVYSRPDLAYRFTQTTFLTGLWGRHLLGPDDYGMKTFEYEDIYVVL